MIGNSLSEQESNLWQCFSDSFMQDVNLGVVLMSKDFKLTAISDMACKILGVERPEVLRHSLEEVFAKVPVEHRLIERTIFDGLTVRNHAVSWTNNAERYELLMDSHLVKDAEGEIVGAYLIFKDVTNLRSLEAQVQRSDRLAMIGQIAAGTAHEIRNPLTSIKGFMQLLRTTFQSCGMDKEFGFTDIILEEIERINRLVSEFLLLSKPKDVHYESLNLTGVTQEAISLINNEAILYNVDIQYKPERLPNVIGDRELLKQVFLNLCKNAIEAMPDGGGTLVINERFEPESGKVLVDFRDSGPGIPAFLIDKIFDPFFTTKEDGTGLGLSICQRIIHDLNGYIRVASKGFGTTFTVALPADVREP